MSLFMRFGSLYGPQISSYPVLLASKIDDKIHFIFGRRKSRPRDQQWWHFGPLTPSKSSKNDKKTYVSVTIAFFAPSGPSDEKSTKKGSKMSPKWSPKWTQKPNISSKKLCQNLRWFLIAFWSILGSKLGAPGRSTNHLFWTQKRENLSFIQGICIKARMWKTVKNYHTNKNVSEENPHYKTTHLCFVLIRCSLFRSVSPQRDHPSSSWSSLGALLPPPWAPEPL